MKKVILLTVILVAFMEPVSALDQPPRIDVFKAVLLNVIPGYGIGSMVQGDSLGGSVQLVLDLAGIIVFFASFDRLAPDSGWLFDYIVPGVEAVLWAGTLIVPALAWGIARPICYARRRGAALQGQQVTFNLFPAMTACADRRGFDVGVGLEMRWALE